MSKLRSPSHAAQPRKNLERTVAAAVLALTGINGTLAQTSSETTGAFAIEEVVVTATKREESMQDIPIAMSVVTSEDMDRQGLTNIQDLQYAIPNLAMNVVTPYASWINLRGIPSNPNGVFNSGSSPGLGVYVDGVVFARQTGFNQELANIERVEVLRGPQGTLFGQNTNLGVISYTTRKPGNELEGKIKASAGSFSSKKYSGYVSGPIIEDVLSVGVSLFGVDSEGADESGYDNDAAYNEDRKGGRIQLSYTPSSQLAIDINADYLKDTGSGITRPDITKVTPGGTVFGALAFSAAPSVETMTIDQIVVPGKRTVSTRSDENKSKRNNKGLDITVSYELDNGITLKSITAQKDYDARLEYELSGTALRILPNFQEENNSQFTQELQILSSSEDAVRYVAGLFYLDNESTNEQALTIGEHAYFILPPGSTTWVDAEVETKSVAIFGNITADLGESTNGFIGVRYSEVTKDIILEQEDNLFIFGLADVPRTEQKYDDDFVSWTAGLNHAVKMDHSEINFYGKVSQGYKEGGFTVRTLTNSEIGPDPLNPDFDFGREDVLSYELGMKGTFFDRQLRVNLAAFYLDYSDIQTTVFDDNNIGSIRNGPEAVSEGFEADVTWIVSDYVRFTSAVGFSDATYKDFENCSATVDCSGNRVAGSNKWTANMGVDYNYPLVDSWSLMGGVDLSYRSGRFASAQNTQGATPEHFFVNAQIGVSSDEQGLDILLIVKNLLDDDNILSEDINTQYGYESVRYSPSRSYTVQATYRF